jgi:cytochrome d ubiquinol oxidase subunit II
MEQIINSENWLPVAFAAIMGFAILAYVILDGYDLGVGILLHQADNYEKDLMIASIGPFWDANETWLVLGVGILLIAFPIAHGEILTALYLPVAIMLFGLILRGVAFDFRVKAEDHHKKWWNNCFFIGSLIAALAQGYMLGMYILGFKQQFQDVLFSIMAAICLAAGYCFIGASWLIMKTEDQLQKKAIIWASITIRFTALGLGLISIITPLISARIFNKWFSMPNFIILLPIPIFTGLILIILHLFLKNMRNNPAHFSWVPFAGAVAIFMLAFNGLCYSFYPYIIPEKMTIWEAASSGSSLMLIFIGTIIVLPCILGYTFFAYKVFWGKVELKH